MSVTGERVSTATGGFNPTWQRHVAAYRLCASFLPQGPVLDLGCGVGHSFEVLAPRETVGLDLDPDALAGQDRETVVADMRTIPFPASSFASVLSVHSIEHVPEPTRVVAEAARVVEPTGTAVFVTPNRLTFARPDEIIDPYHYVELDLWQLRQTIAPCFAEVEVLGLFGSPRYLELVHEQLDTLDALLRRDRLRLRRAVPRGIRKRLYDLLLTRARATGDARTAAITMEDFELRPEPLESALDLVAVCRAPSSR